MIGDFSASIKSREKGLARALAALGSRDAADFSELPPPWVKSGKKRRRKDLDEDVWIDPDPSFNAQFASKIFSMFPLEVWCKSEKYRPKMQDLLAKLAAWTRERLAPSWRDHKSRQDRESHLFEWSHTHSAQ